MHYQGKKRGKQIESGRGTGRTNKRKCVSGTFFSTLSVNKLSQKYWGGGSLKTPHLHIFLSILAFLNTL